MRRIETLIAASPSPTRDQTILLACPAGEWHTFPALMLNLSLRRKGFNVVYLGANTPLEDLEQTAVIVHPAAVILTAQRLTTAASVREAALLFQKMNIPFAYGGRIFNCIPELHTRIPGGFLGETLPEAASQLEKVILHQRITPKQNEDDLPVLSLLFRSRMTQIEARVLELSHQKKDYDYLDEVGKYLSSSLSAAVVLGDLTF